MGRPVKIVPGTVFGKLTVLENRPDGYLCRCGCGNVKLVPKSNLCRKGSHAARDCGCVRRSGDSLRGIMRRRNRSGYVGVSPMKGKWRADVCVRGTISYLGVYDTPEEVAQVRRKWLKENGIASKGGM